MTCSSCGTALLPGAKFCGECGTPAVAACRECGTQLVPNLKFCPECGTPTEHAASMLSGSAVTSRPPGSAPVAERRVTSVLFGDLVGFTALSEARDPEEVRELLSRYFDTARGVVTRYGGTIEKFIGDAVMAVWGVPTAHEDDAERAVRAGVDLAESVAAFGESVGAPGLAMRVGVVTGEVAVTLGATGEGMVAGDAVNTAARVQAKADPGSVWVDAQTRALAGGSIDFADAGVHELKGKAEPVELFAATAVMGGVRGDRSTDRVQAPLVGRRRELSVLKEMFHVAAEEGRPRLVVLSGDAGVGKTRLSRELENYLDGLSATVLWHRGRCLAYGDGVGFSALASAVRGRIGASEDDPEQTTRARLTASLEAHVPDADDRAWLFPALANLLGFGGSTAMTREELFSAWLTWFERLPSQPGDSIVWVVDDAQYADDGLLDFIQHLSTVAQAGLLMVLMARPELLSRRPELAALRRANVVGLETLSRGDMAALFDGLVEGLPEDVRDALIERAEGVPLFAIETVRAMNDQGLTVAGPTRRAGAVRLATGVDAQRLDALAAPATLQVLVASRLDLLPPRERALITTASVLGQTFSRAAMRAVSELSDDELSAALRELIARDWLTTVTDRLSSEDGQYAFVQTVVRTVAYQTLSRRDRLQRHLAIVDFLESSADGDGLSAVIAQHLRDALAATSADDAQRADIARRLGDWLERSAARSESIGAPAEAMRGYAEALTLASDDADRVRLQLATANAALDCGMIAEALPHAIPIAIGEVSAGPLDVATAVELAARSLRNGRRFDEAWALLEPHLDEANLGSLPTLHAAKLALPAAAVLNDLARFDEAATWTERALRLAEDSGDARVIGEALNSIALTYMLRASPRVGWVVLKLASDYAREHRLVLTLARTLMNEVAMGMSRDLSAAVAAGREALLVAEQGGNMHLCWHTAGNQSVALGLAGHWDELASLPDRPLLHEPPPVPVLATLSAIWPAVVARARGNEIDLAEYDALATLPDAGTGNNIDAMFFLTARALHARASGARGVVVQSCHRIVDLALTHVQFEDDFPWLWTLAADLLLDVRAIDDARVLLRIVEDAPAPRLSPLLAAELARVQGTIEVVDPSSTADPDTIEQHLLDGIAKLDGVGARPDRARTQATLGTWLWRSGRSAEAAPHLDAARTVFTELQATVWLKELDDALAQSAAG
jgi:class 3 adenylate cyclase/tetratricopeptide (TPR) repeat protein